MGRPIYTSELTDPDFSWLIEGYRQQHPECLSVEMACVPVVLIVFGPNEKSARAAAGSSGKRPEECVPR